MDRYTIVATDGDIGTVVDVLFDDERWTVRNWVVQMGGVFHERRVLVSPISMLKADWASRQLVVALTMDQVKNSPNIDSNAPVSRQHERDFYRYYGYSYYWGGTSLWGMGLYPGVLGNSRWEDDGHAPSGDVHLRSAKEVKGYHIEGTDGAIGHVDDFIVDDHTWAVRYLVIDTRNWWFGKRVLVAPLWASRVSWSEQTVHMALSRQAIKASPEWVPTASINREYEARLYNYYGQPVYWDTTDPASLTPIQPHII